MAHINNNVKSDYVSTSDKIDRYFLERYGLYGMSYDVEEHIRTCPLCIRLIVRGELDDLRKTFEGWCWCGCPTVVNRLGDCKVTTCEHCGTEETS